MSASLIEGFLIDYSNADFTNPHEVVRPDSPKDCRGDFTHMGAKYWGFETKRHKATSVLPDEQSFVYDHNAHNWFRIGLKQRAEITTVTISTKWYTGNHIRAVSVILKDELTGNETRVLDHVSLDPDAPHKFPVEPTIATEAKIECHYEGGIARVNFWGTPTPEQLPLRKNLLDDAPISHISNEHYGKPSQAVAGSRKEMHMIGWESARTGFGEQALFHLKKPARISEIVIDTYLHRLNAPLASHVFAVNTPESAIDSLMKQAPRWKLVFDDGSEVIPDDFQSYMLAQQYRAEKGADRFKICLHQPANSPWIALLPFAPLSPDTFHRFRSLDSTTPVTHILYMHYPNGGIHGLKVFGIE